MSASRRRSAAAAAVGVLGEVLITLGVLLGLFVAWQLWWTDVIAERAQSGVIDELAWEPFVYTGPMPTPITATPTPEAVDPVRRDMPPPTMAEPAHLTTFATMYVPRWGLDWVSPVSQGTSKSDVLDVLGVGHYEGTAMPGGIGNFAIAGHRTTYGKPFNRVEELVIGDPIVIQTETNWYVYRVSSTQIVLPHQVEVIAAVPGQPGVVPTEAFLTMTTCHPMYSARERFIVHAILDYWMAAADGPPAELTGGA
jgi:sortase A